MTPVFKKGNKSVIDNYRPVAQSSIPCIVFEKLLADHIMCHLKRHSLLDPNQHGFTGGRSTSTQMVEMTHEWATFLNDKDDFVCVYFDFSKAFDKVNHGLLIEKMTALGIDSKTINWVKSYLSDRTFLVKVGKSLSPEFKCTSGVPQGSVLGPLLFLIFVLDLPKSLPSCVSYKFYADDLKLYTRYTDSGKVDLQRGIDEVALWCNLNGMHISESKCAVMSSCELNHQFTLSGKPLPVVSKYRDLGVIINPRLDFHEHIASVILSASRITNTIFRCFIVKQPEFYLKLYVSLVIPKLLYCCEVWRPYRKCDVTSIESLQSKFLRRVSLRCGVPRESLCLPNISDLFKKADLSMYKRLSKLESFNDIFDINVNNLRSNFNVRTKKVARNDKVNNMFAWRLCRILHDENIKL